MRIKTYMLLLVFALTTLSCSLPKISLFPERGPLKEVTLQGSGAEKVLVIPINGIISDQPKDRLLLTQPSLVQQVVSQLKRAEQDPKIKALLLKVNSPGGTVTASDILYHEISEYKKRSGAKIVVAMMNVAASGGYYISLPADWIMAHPTTVTGSVGVIFMRPGVSGLMQKVGLSMEVNTSGPQKDMGSPFRKPTDAEKAIFQSLTDGLAQRFLGLVSQHRHLGADQKTQIASARVYLAPEAQKIGLVDQIGYLNDAIAKAKSLAGLSADARVITFRHQVSEDDTIYNPATENTGGEFAKAIPLLGPLTESPSAGFYYLWPVAMGQ